MGRGKMNEKAIESLINELGKAQAERDIITEQRDALMELVRHMRRIARPYPQWENWWDQLGGEALDLENKMTEGEDDN